jgi:signal transduction histidine kinase
MGSGSGVGRRRRRAGSGVERARIARELHDVVAHHMSVVALQTGVAGYVLGTDGEAARKAITSAASASREALGDMGRMLGALRADDGLSPADLTPQPGLADLPQLVENMRGAGLEIELSMSATWAICLRASSCAPSGSSRNR